MAKNANSSENREAKIKISLVVPVYNEEESIGLFLEAVRRVLVPLNQDYEIVFVNDGSRDNTYEVLLNEANKDSNVKLVNLSRNFGKEAALTAGLEFSAGDVMVPIDVDLQDPPELIPTFVEKWREGFDVVNGLREDRSSDSAVKRQSANYFYRIFNVLSHMELPENVGDFRLLDKKVVEAILAMPERNRFLKGLFAWVGFKTTDVPYTRPPRAAGSTSWNYWKLWNFALDGIFSFSTLPLRIWTYAGVLLAAIGMLYGFFITVQTLIYGVQIPGYASLTVFVLFFSGIQILSLGILGEYVGRIFIEVKQRPQYLVREVYVAREASEVKEVQADKDVS